MKRAPHPDVLPNMRAPGAVDHPELVPFVVAEPWSLPVRPGASA